jgi:hypothetical protein
MSSVAILGPSLPARRVFEEPPQIWDLVQEVALKVLKEFAISLVLGAVVALFVTSQADLFLLLSSAIVQLIVSTFFHSLSAYARHQAHPSSLVSFSEWMNGFNFALLTGFNTQTVIHEAGHASASLLLYKNPRPLIEIYPFAGGITQFYKTALSSLGQKLGAPMATCAVIASGPGLTLLLSSGLLILGIALLDTHPQLGKTLVSWALVDFFHHSFYAYTAFQADPWNLTHDFVHLSIFGLHPGVAAIGILAIPALISLGMYLQRREPQLLVAAQNTA